MAVFDLPQAQRRRWQEQLAALGAGRLSDHELLAMLLGSGASSGVGAHTLTERLLSRFGSVAAIARAHPADLAVVAGIGPVRAGRLSAAFELARRAVEEPPVIVKSNADVAAAAWPLLGGRSRERAVVVICNGQNRLLGCEVLSDGSAAKALLPIRETLVAVLRRDGRAFALVHNHPSGDPTPSSDDIEATWSIRRAAEAADLRFMDHVVVTDGEWRRVG